MRLLWRHMVLLALVRSMSGETSGVFTRNSRNVSEFVKFALDFISTQSNHKVVVENLCWSRGDKLLLDKSLTAEGTIRFRSVPSSGPIGHCPHVVLASTACSNFDTLWSEALASGLATYPNVWLVLDELGRLDAQQYHVPINALVITPMSVEAQPPRKALRTVYRVRANDGPLRVQTLGEWSETTRTLHLGQSPNPISSRTNFARSPLRVSYIITHKDSFNHLTDGRDIHLDSVTKINYPLYDSICDLLNATQVRLFADDWGLETGNQSTFSKGMFEDLVYDRSDVAGTISFTPTSRAKYFRYVFAPIKDSIRFVFRAPSLAYHTNLFVLPFARAVWIAIAVLLALTVAVVKVIFAWEARGDAFARNYEANEENVPTILDVVIMQMAILCQADFCPPPKSISGMMGLFTVLITFTFIYTAFSARIVLLLQSNTEQINDVESLYRANFEFGGDNQQFNVYYFTKPNVRSDEYWRKLIYETRIRKSNGDRFFEAKEGMRLVRKTHFAFSTQMTIAYYFIDKTYNDEEKCSVRVVDTIYKVDVPYLAIPRNSSYYEYLKVAFQRLADVGIHAREYRRYFTRKPSCDGKGGTFVSVGLTEGYFPFAVYVSGVCLSVALLTVELLVHHHFRLSCTL